MDKILPNNELAQIIARLNRSSSEALLNSLAEELLRLQQAHRVIEARMHALEITQTIQDQIASSIEQTEFQSMPRSVEIDASFALPAESGFHPLEYDTHGPYRWTGPDPIFYFEVFVDRKVPAILRMHYTRVRFKDSPRSIRCFVDGNEINPSVVDVPGGFEVHGVLPTRAFTGGTVISFVCPNVSSPASEGESQDIRMLGLTFRWLRIEPSPIVISGREANPQLPATESAALKLPSSAKSPRRNRSAADHS